MQKFWDMVLSHFLSFTVVVLEVMIFQNKKSVVLEVGKNHKDCFEEIVIEKKKLPKLRQNCDLQSIQVAGQTDKNVEIVVIIDL